jgi:hypothetical protein
LWLGAFMQASEIIYSSRINFTPGSLLIDWLLSVNDLVATITAFILTLCGAFLLNYIVTKNNIFPRNSLLPALIYVILMSHSPHMLKLSSVIFAILFLLLVLNNIFLIYHRSEDYENVYMMGFWIAIASFFDIQSLFLVFFVWFTFLAYRLYYWREWTIVLLGLITPYLFLWTYYFWIDELGTLFLAYAEGFREIDFVRFTSFNFSYLYYLIIAAILGFFIWSFIIVSSAMGKRIIHYRKMLWSLIWLLLVSIVIFLFSGEGKGSSTLLLIPVSIFIASGLNELKRTFWAEIAISFLTLMIVINNYLLSF